MWLHVLRIFLLVGDISPPVSLKDTADLANKKGYIQFISSYFSLFQMYMHQNIASLTHMFSPCFIFLILTQIKRFCRQTRATCFYYCIKGKKIQIQLKQLQPDINIHAMKTISPHLIQNQTKSFFFSFFNISKKYQSIFYLEKTRTLWLSLHQLLILVYLHFSRSIHIFSKTLKLGLCDSHANVLTLFLLSH